METLIAQATDFITQNSMWAGPVLGLLAFGESLAIIGFLIPSTALLIATGGLIGLGTVPALPVLLWAIGGAVVGDWLSYFIGRRFGARVYRRPPLNRYRTPIARARLFFRRYGFLAVFLGRFLGPVRSTIPLVAGVMQMDRRRFQLSNVLSAVLWVPLMFMPGYVAVRSVGTAEHISQRHILGISLLAVVLTVIATGIGARVLSGGGERRRDRKRGGGQE